MTVKYKISLIFAGVCAGFIYLFLCPQAASSAIAEGLHLCANTIVPSMFPYFVLSGLFVSLGCADALGQKLSRIMMKIFHISGQGAAPLLLGLVGGYPMGAKTIADLHSRDLLTRAEAEKLLFFCCNAGPAFIIGVVGGALYHSSAIGLSLYGIHMASAFLCGLFCTSKKSKQDHAASQQGYIQPLSFSSALVQAVEGALGTTLKVCSLITFFSLLISVENQLFSTVPLLCTLFSGLTELSTGCTAVAAADLSWHMKYTITSALLAFGGICVLFQTLSVMSGTQLCIKPYLCGKLLHAVVSAALAYPVSYFLQPSVPAASIPVTVQPFSPFPWNFFPILLLLLIFLQLPPRNSSRSAL